MDGFRQDIVIGTSFCVMVVAVVILIMYSIDARTQIRVQCIQANPNNAIVCKDF